AVTQMGQLPVALYAGGLYDSNVSVLIPKDPFQLPAVWAYLQSNDYQDAVRLIDKKMGVTNSTLIKVPVDLARWQKAAGEMDALPEPYSNAPTQWLFKGDPSDSTAPLQVAVVRLLGYHWPQQEPDRLSALADEDGI